MVKPSRGLRRINVLGHQEIPEASKTSPSIFLLDESPRRYSGTATRLVNNGSLVRSQATQVFRLTLKPVVQSSYDLVVGGTLNNNTTFF